MADVLVKRYLAAAISGTLDEFLKYFHIGMTQLTSVDNDQRAFDFSATGCGSLLFLEQLIMFHGLIKNRKLRKASLLLVDMLTTNIAPMRYWPILLLDSVALLEARDMVLNSEDTFEVMRCLQDLDQSRDKDKFFSEILSIGSEASSQGDVVTRHEQIDTCVLAIRSACTRNLARSFLLE
jgi:nuclear pore complex protein Nup85